MGRSRVAGVLPARCPGPGGAVSAGRCGGPRRRARGPLGIGIPGQGGKRMLECIVAAVSPVRLCFNSDGQSGRQVPRVDGQPDRREAGSPGGRAERAVG
jgi:hypothetical protein